MYSPAFSEISKSLLHFSHCFSGSAGCITIDSFEISEISSLIFEAIELIMSTFVEGSITTLQYVFIPQSINRFSDSNSLLNSLLWSKVE